MADTYDIDSRGRLFILKDPDATLDFPFDWTEWLTDIDDTIFLVDIIVDTANGLVLASQSHTTTTATAWVSGGTVGSYAFVTCRIFTTKGRKDDRSIYLKIKER